MSDISFARPWLLAALPIFPALAVVWFVAASRARQRTRLLTRGRLARPPHLAALLFLVAGALATVAAAQPQWGEEHSRVPRSGTDLMVVLDVSRSMDAGDLQPSRMDVTKEALQDLFGRLGGDRVGLVIFGGDARLRFPLTTDLAAASQVVATIETAPVFVSGGSSASAGLTIALDSFDESSESNRVILLLTDGDDLGPDPASVADRLRSTGTELLVAGIGTSDGATIPVFDPQSNQFVDKVDAGGEPILTRLNEPFLRTLAAASGGRYLGSDLSSVPGAVIGRMTALQRTRFADEVRPIPVERYHWFAGAALGALVVASVVEWLPRPSRRTAFGGLAVGAALLMGCASRAYELNDEAREAFNNGDTDRAITLFLEAQAERPDNPQIRLNLAAAYHAAERYDEAILAARTLLVESNPEVRARAHSSIGHHMFATGDLQGALGAFRDALLEDPDDEDARHDYEVVLRLLEPPEQPPDTGGETPAPGGPPEGTPEPGGTAPPASPTPGEPGETGTPGARPGSPEEIDRQIADLDAEIDRLLEEAGEEPSASDAHQILQLLAERQRIAALRDALEGGGDPGDY